MSQLAALAAALEWMGRLTALALVLLIFECSFPLAWSGQRAAAILVAIGVCFHSFVFAWAAADPELLWCSAGLR